MKRLNCIKDSNFVWILTALVLCGVLNVAPMALAAGDIWTTRAEMPTARFALSTSVVDGKIYAIGGAEHMYGECISIVETHDPATDTWAIKADMPTPRGFLSTSVVDGKIYAIGGAPRDNTTTSAVEEYEPVTDTWTTKAEMPTARFGLSTSVVNGKIYAIGGRTEPGGGRTATVEECDPATDTWTTRTDMPTRRFIHSASVVNGKIYVISGSSGSFHGPALSTVEEYDPATDTWVRKTDMPTARQSLSASVVDGQIYAIGGAKEPDVYATVEVYDPVTDTWTTKADMITARHILSTSVVNRKIYAIGGSALMMWWRSSTVEEYDVGLVRADVDADGIVDIQDLVILIENWGLDEPSLDVAPLPFGDGIVNIQDLEVLMSYWGQELNDPTFIAHWKLDETDGLIACDSAGELDGTVHGGPLWQPEDGIVGGALEFDGGDYVSISSFMSTAESSLSVFAWIKGSMPGQVIISQKGRSDWLLADATEGGLMTELEFLGMSGVPLYSHAVITDGNWHHVGLAWDGSNRILHVDGVEVVSDKCEKGRLFGGLQIGAGKNLDIGTFWSGLIDDVRIYNRALSAAEIKALAR